MLEQVSIGTTHKCVSHLIWAKRSVSCLSCSYSSPLLIWCSLGWGQKKAIAIVIALWWYWFCLDVCLLYWFCLLDVCWLLNVSSLCGDTDFVWMFVDYSMSPCQVAFVYVLHIAMYCACNPLKFLCFGIIEILFCIIKLNASDTWFCLGISVTPSTTRMRVCTVSLHANLPHHHHHRPPQLCPIIWVPATLTSPLWHWGQRKRMIFLNMWLRSTELTSPSSFS